jgi:pyridoxamine 5'-phosphate oxidase
MAAGDDFAAQDPLLLFDLWFVRASEQEPNDPNASALATATTDGRPSVRMVLAKRIGDERFCFFTNDQSRKGRELAANRHVALCFHWKSLRRQVRVEGPVSELTAQESDAYFHSRSRASQISAAVSDQSRPLDSRAILEEKVGVFTAAHPGEIPRPACWRGFRVEPESMEFWISGEARLHDRLLFTRSGSAWVKTLLYP